MQINGCNYLSLLSNLRGPFNQFYWIHCRAAIQFLQPIFKHCNIQGWVGNNKIFKIQSFKSKIQCQSTQCQFFGFTENHADESIIIFHDCSTNMFLWDNNDTRDCNELHTGNTPRSIMTKGSSTSKGTVYGNLIRGNKDKLMISYLRHDNYTMSGTCTALFDGDMHFFGGSNYSTNTMIESESGYEGVVTINVIDFTRQHFMIKTHRTG